MVLSEYQWDIKYKPGRKHTNADSLSTQPIPVDVEATGKSDDGSERLKSLLSGCRIVRLESVRLDEDVQIMQIEDRVLENVLRQFPEKLPVIGV